MDVPWLLRVRAAQRGDHPFLIWEPFDGRTETFTYTGFHARVRTLAAALARRGVGAGDRLLVHLDNCPEMLLAWFACAEIGAVAVTTNTRSALAELRYFAENCAAVAAITQPRYAALVDEAAPALRWIAATETDSGQPPEPGTLPGRAERFGRLLAEGEGREPPPRLPDPLAPVSVQYTSGTTSRPKGVVWTHANALWGARTNAVHEELRPDDIHLVALPLFHAAGLAYCVLATLWAGCTAVLQPRFSANRFWSVAVKHRATFVVAVPFCVRALMNSDAPGAHHVRLFGMARSDPAVARRFGVGIVSFWGMTETITHGIHAPPGLPITPGAIGWPAPEYGVEILRPDGTPVAPGETGDLLIRGQRGVSLFHEYLGDPAATAGAFDEAGRFRTGDRVTLLPDGAIRFADRAKDMLKVGGENVASSEVEAVIAAVPGVREVAVVGKRHPMLDQVPVAFVILGPSAAADVTERIRTACTAGLADFKRPVEVRVVADFPRSTIEKISKAELRRQLVAEG
ncbi:MAG: AMP-binding protein [Acetobacteraceae bacterium]|nr:AMP-binding protein [Acetobacteraceae bacterium]